MASLNTYTIKDADGRFLGSTVATSRADAELNAERLGYTGAIVTKS